VDTPTAGQTGTLAGAIAAGSGPQTHYPIERQPPAGSCHYTVVDAAMGEYLPDPKCTPGAISPAVTQDNLASTICKKGYTKSVRPPEDVTDAEKAANAASYSYTGSLKTAEYDHFIPLELGGDPNDPRNLWVEPNDATASTVNNPKDGVESSLNYLVCNAIHGKPYLPLAKAQELIATNWTTAKVLARQLLVSN
jgi:5-methylcytosine-specific restriction endonuclease McrA